MGLYSVFDFSHHAKGLLPSSNDRQSTPALLHSPQGATHSTELAAAILIASSLIQGYKKDQLEDCYPENKYQMFSSLIESQSLLMDAGIQREMLVGIPHLKPADGVISCDYHPGHLGVDTRLQPGSPVYSSMDGDVVFAGWNFEGYGNLVVIQNGMFTTYYAHLSACEVKMDDVVTAGMLIGRSGSSGNAGGPHLHYEVRINGKPEDPSRYYGKRFSKYS
jgi:murein DD-endopeptidase MepM/ murein hydrolase activator NlpD